MVRPGDAAGLDYARDLGDPGAFPFTRGIHPLMYRSRLWTMRQYAGYATAEESNERYRYLLSRGTAGLSVAFDLPTQIGLDSDHPLAAGEVGRVGVAIDTVEDMDTLFREIPLERVSTSMTINATAATLLALYLVVARRRGLQWKSLRGTVQNDILKEYIARGTYIYPARPSLRLVTDLFAFCSQHLPHWNPISISGYHMREAGSTAAQELGFTLANAETYLEAAGRAGLEINALAPRLSFFFSAHNNLFEEVAKFRAARRLWARLTRDRLGATNPQAWRLRFHVQTAGSTLTAQQPANNIVRVTLQALAAVLGGAQSLHTNAMDEALSLPTEKAVRIALRTQQILAWESGIAATPDPLAGSWHVERMTRLLEEEAESYLEKIRELGGMLGAIENGYVEREIQEAAYRYQRRVEEGQAVVVGVNRFQVPQTTTIERLHIDPEVERRQVRRLNEFRSARSAVAVAEKLDLLRQGAESQVNLMPTLVEAVEAGATVGEVAAALKDVFGEYRQGASV